MANELSDYMRAYDHGSVGELANLFTPDLIRSNGNDPAENRDAALRTYEHQFSVLSNRQYQLSNVRYQTGQDVGTARGDYVITSSAGQSQGRIWFEFVARDGFLFIDKIAIVPS